MTDNKNIILSGMGGGKSSPTEVKDNRYSEVLARVLIAYSHGETDGLIDGAKSIFLNETQLQASDNSNNFDGVLFTESTGSGFDDNSVAQKFEATTSVVSINASLEFGTPIVRTVSNIDVDGVRFIITIPGLQEVDGDGNISGTTVQIKLEVRDPGVGVWEDRGTFDIEGKSTGAFQRQFDIVEPLNKTGAWDWRVTRLTAESDNNRLNNSTTLQAAVEIFYGKEEYLGTAAIGMEFDTSAFGNTLPELAFEVSGARVRVPSNYTVTDGIPSYSGAWNGEWQYASTSNPVWHLYHLLIDDTVGLGLPESFVDRYNFYDVARYNDAVDNNGTFVGIPDGDGGVRRRFTMNTQIRGQQEGIKMLQEIASSMRAILYFGAGAVILKQDAPRNTARIVTNDNVKDGIFAYSSTAAKDRITVAKVGYNDPNDYFKLKYVQYPATEDWGSDSYIQRFGRNELEVTKFGCASEAEAYTYAKWIVFSSCNEDRTVSFIGSPELLLTRPGDVIEIADRRLAGAASLDQRFGGRIAGGSTNTLLLDYPVTLAAGESYTATIISADGETLETKTITTGPGETSTITVSDNWSSTPTVGYTWLITGTDIAPQKFSVINVERKEGLEVEIFAVKYVESKFSAVELGTAIVQTPYTRIETGIRPPTNLLFQIVPRKDATGATLNSLVVKWTASPSKYATRYEAFYRRDKGPLQPVPPTTVNEFIIDPITLGTYDVFVYAVNPEGIRSPALTGTKVIEYGVGQPDWNGNQLTIQPPIITSDPAFGGKDLTIDWERNPANDIPGIVFKDYVVDIYVSGILQRTIIADVQPRAVYYYDDMVVDQGQSPSRVIDVRVRERDTLLRTSAEAQRTFTNAAPQAPTYDLTSGFTNIFIEIQEPSDIDIIGYYVFRDSFTGFTPSAANVVYKGPERYITDEGLSEGVTYYYRVAAYDVFDDSIDNLIISGEISRTTAELTGVITEYEFENIQFTKSGASVFWTGGTVFEREGDTVTTVSVSGGFVTDTGAKQYIYYDPNTQSIATSTSLVAIYQGGEKRRILASWDSPNLQEGIETPIIDGSQILAETVGATQVVSSNLITNTAQIVDGLIGTAKIQNAAITTAKIGTAAVATANIGVAQVDTLRIGNDAVTVPQSQTISSAIAGNGSFIEVQWFNHTLDYAGEILILWNAAQGYSGTASHTAQIRIDGSVVMTRGGTATNDYPNMAFSGGYSAGTRRIAIWWQASSSNITLNARTLSVLGVKR
jgi:hypothetical protein